MQFMTLLADTNTYRGKIEYPTKDISNLLSSTLIRFKHILYNYNPTSYQTTNTTRYLNSIAYQKSTKRFNTYHPSDLSSHIVTPLTPCSCATTGSHTITLSTIIPRLPTQFHNTLPHITSNTTTRQCHTSYY